MTTLFGRIKSGEESISLIGLGYVGMPIAVAFANEGVKVIGFDLNKEKIELYKKCQMILAEDAASVYIQDAANLVAVNEKLDGYVFYPCAAQDMSGVHFVE